MGMGASGINFAYQLAKRTTGIELVIYEKNVSAFTIQHLIDQAFDQRR